jgi:hypothetical protein
VLPFTWQQASAIAAIRGINDDTNKNHERLSTKRRTRPFRPWNIGVSLAPQGFTSCIN